MAASIAAVVLLGTPSGASAGWISTGAMGASRTQHTATLLPDGTVFVAGGDPGGTGSGFLQLYVPSSKSWSMPMSMPAPWATVLHTATLLPNGRILVAGGKTPSSGPTNWAYVYDPVTKTYLTSTMNAVRYDHTATLLPNGKVLVTGGCQAGRGSDVATAELYDPATNRWSWTGSMSAPRSKHTATIILGSYVLVAGGGSLGFLRSAEIYNVSQGTWFGAPDMLVARALHTATAIATDKVLVVGGLDTSGAAARSAEIFSAWAWKWTSAGGPAVPRLDGHSATRLGNGLILIAGGETNWNGPAQTSAEFYDPSSNVWYSAGYMNASHKGHTATLLGTGSVLVAAGDGSGYANGSSSLYIPPACAPNTYCGPAASQ